MKIENSITANAPVSGDMTSAKSSQKAEIAGQSMASGLRDSIQLSSRFQDIEKNLSNSEVFDSARVEEIKQAISEGRFAVNPEKVADHLLENVRDLLRSRQG